MNLLPKHGADFASKDYWKSFFDKQKDPFEWYGNYFDLAHILTKYVKAQDEILMVGCGNSELSEELYSKQDCKLITNIDISENVIERMKKKSAENGISMIYEVGDVTNMKYTDESFNAVIGKFCKNVQFSSNLALSFNNYFLDKGRDNVDNDDDLFF